MERREGFAVFFAEDVRRDAFHICEGFLVAVTAVLHGGFVHRVHVQCDQRGVRVYVPGLQAGA